MFEHRAHTDIFNVMRQTDIICYDVGNGGYKPHTYDEYLIVEDAQESFALALDLLQTIGLRFERRFPIEDRFIERTL